MQQTVGVLVAAALPQAVRVGEVHLHAGTQGQRIVITHLLALVVGERLAQRFGNALQGFTEALQRVGSAGAAHLGQYDEAAGALDQGTHGGTVSGALDEVALPMLRNHSVRDVRLAHVDALHVRDLTTPVSTPCTRLARAATLPQTSDQLLAKLAAWHQVDRAVDRFVGHPVARCVGKTSRQYPGDLLRRPARPQQRLHRFPQRRISQLARDAGLGPALLAALLCCLCLVARAFGARSAALAADRARRSSQRAPDGTQALTGFQTLLHLHPLSQPQFVIRSHRNSLCQN